MISRDIYRSRSSIKNRDALSRSMQQTVSTLEEATPSSVAPCFACSVANRAPIDPDRRQREGGYLLLAILLMMALMIVAATIEAPRMVQQMKRDREEEMIHRGTEYARAVKKYYKKFGRYPANLEQLENTNQIRFLRKRYKDPLTKDGKWKLLNYTDIQTLSNPAAPGTPAAGLGAQGLGAQGLGAQGQGAQAQGAFGQPSAVSSVVANLAPSAQQPALNGGNIANTSPTGFDQGSPLSAQQQSGTTGNSQGGSAPNLPQGNPQQGNSPFTNTFSLGSSGASNSNQQGSTSPGTNPAGGNQTFGGGAIVGVASLSKDPTIRIYNKKKTYNEWWFIYNPQMDTGKVLLRGPYQPMTIGGAQVGTPAGQINNQQSGFGQPQSGVSQPSTGFGQQQNSPQQTSPVNQFPPDQNQH